MVVGARGGITRPEGDPVGAMRLDADPVGARGGPGTSFADSPAGTSGVPDGPTEALGPKADFTEGPEGMNALGPESDGDRGEAPGRPADATEEYVGTVGLEIDARGGVMGWQVELRGAMGLDASTGKAIGLRGDTGCTTS